MENPDPSDRYRRASLHWLLIISLIAAPLFRAGQAPIALLALELLAVAILVLALWTNQQGPVTWRESLALILLFTFPLAYLFPLPAGVLEFLPGRERYSAALSLLDGDVANDSVRLSLFPLETESAWLFLLLPIGVYLGTRALNPQATFKLFLLVLGIAAVQATLGLMQFGDGEESPLYLGMSATHFGSAVGTYTNRNHLAGLLEMVFPVTLALLIYSVGRTQHGFARNWRGRFSFLTSIQGHSAFVYGALTLLLLVGVIFTRSRSGIALTMLGVLLTSTLLSRRIGGNNVYGPMGTVVSVALAVGIVIGLAPVLDRFSAVEVLADSRLTIFSATLEGIGSFFPVGSGPGTYPDVFPAFQPSDLGQWFINHAHNDYLEWLFEGGLFAALLILLLLLLYVHQWSRVWTDTAWTRFQFTQVGAGVGIFLMLLHSLVDYNLHIPANIVYFAFLAAVFFADPALVEPPTHKHRHRRERRTPKLTELQDDASDSPESSNSADSDPVTAPPEQIKNPFLD